MKKRRPPLAIRLKPENEVCLLEIMDYYKLDNKNMALNKLIEDWNYCIKWLPLAHSVANVIFNIELIQKGNTTTALKEMTKEILPRKDKKTINLGDKMTEIRIKGNTNKS